MPFAVARALSLDSKFPSSQSCTARSLVLALAHYVTEFVDSVPKNVRRVVAEGQTSGCTKRVRSGGHGGGRGTVVLLIRQETEVRIPSRSRATESAEISDDWHPLCPSLLTLFTVSQPFMSFLPRRSHWKMAARPAKKRIKLPSFRVETFAVFFPVASFF